MIKKLLIILLIVPKISFASDWTMEALLLMLDGCTNDKPSNLDILSIGEKLEYCACSARKYSELISLEQTLNSYENGELNDLIYAVNEEHQINKVCTEKILNWNSLKQVC